MWFCHEKDFFHQGSPFVVYYKEVKYYSKDTNNFLKKSFTLSNFPDDILYVLLVWLVCMDVDELENRLDLKEEEHIFTYALVVLVELVWNNSVVQFNEWTWKQITGTSIVFATKLERFPKWILKDQILLSLVLPKTEKAHNFSRYG